MKTQTKIKLILALVFFLLFCALTVLIVTLDVRTAGPCDTKVGLASLNTALRDAIGQNHAMYRVSKWIGLAAIAVSAAAALFGVLQLIMRKSLLKVDRAILLLGGLYVLTGLQYVLFEIAKINYRPVLEEGQSFPEASYPSSHTLMIAVIFGSAVILAERYIKNAALKRTLQCAGCLLCLLGTAARLLSGVHWCTDVAGGALLALALILLFAGLLDIFAPKEKQAGQTEETE